MNRPTTTSLYQSIHRVLRPLLIATPLWFASSGAYADSWKVNLQNADIHAFINEVAAITNKNFVPDPRINGNVTVVSNRPMNEEQIYQLFLSVMQVNGVVALEKDGLVTLRPDNVAKSSGLPFDGNQQAYGELMVTRVIYLSNVQATEVLSVIRPIMPQSAHAAVVPTVNALVLSDRADSLDQITALVKDLDNNINESLSVIPLRHTNSERMMELISQLTDSATGKQATTGSRLKVIADTAHDSLLVKGSPEQIARVQAMVNRLDTLPSKNLSGMRVFRLNYASATHVSTILSALVAGQSVSSAEATSNLTTASLTKATDNTNKSASSATPTPSSSKTGSDSLDKYGHHFSIIADESKNSIFVNASARTMADIDSAIQEIDIPEVQILIQAAIIEISGDDAEQLGFQWAMGSNNTGYSVINFDNSGPDIASLATAALSENTTAISSATSAIAGALLGIGNSRTNSSGNTQFYGAILQAINKTSSANLLSMPSLITLNHKEASILVGQNVPFVTGSYSNSGSSSSPFQTVERQDVGIQLNVIPHVGANGDVRLDVSQEVSSVVESSTTNISGLTTNKSFINTTVTAKDGQTVALGGLMRENNSANQQKIPGLGDVPVVGRLFRSDNKSTQKSNLIIFLQPTVLRNGGAVASVTENKMNQMKTMQLVIDPTGTIRQIPLTGSQGWYGQEIKLDETSELKTTNPLTPSVPSTYNTSDSLTSQQGFIKIPETFNNLKSTISQKTATGLNKLSNKLNGYTLNKANPSSPYSQPYPSDYQGYPTNQPPQSIRQPQGIYAYPTTPVPTLPPLANQSMDQVINQATNPTPSQPTSVIQYVFPDPEPSQEVVQAVAELEATDEATNIDEAPSNNGNTSDTDSSNVEPDAKDTNKSDINTTEMNSTDSTVTEAENTIDITDLESTNAPSTIDYAGINIRKFVN